MHRRAVGRGPQQGVLDSLGSTEGTGLPSQVGGSVGCGWGGFPWKTPSELVFVGLEQVFMGCKGDWNLTDLCSKTNFPQRLL